MQDYFYSLADAITAMLQGDVVYTCTFHVEDSDFVRLNQSAIRQPGSVQQRSLSLDLIVGRRHAPGTVTLSGDFEWDGERLEALVQELRQKLPYLPEDPYLLYATEVHNSESHGDNRLPAAEDAVAALVAAGAGRDLVGIYASGGTYAGFANSLGQRNWFSSYSFNADWSFYHEKDKAVKTAYAGLAWDTSAFDRKVEAALAHLDVLRQPPQTIAPGAYRVYLSPTALYDILGTLCWGGFGLKDHRTKRTTLLKMVEEDARLHPLVTLSENTAEGTAPNFQDAGFVKPDHVTLIESGRFCNCLVSPRSAEEYGVPTNGASGAEAPEAIDMAAGTLAYDDILKQLDTGLYISNVWYLNYSDRSACRLTGMTRFATFWVENGEIRAPLNVMRFDESIYRLLGDQLIDLTAERELILDAGSYFRRSTDSGRLPGALVDGFTLTL
jgi:predicted Zn-dependent protease